MGLAQETKKRTYTDSAEARAATNRVSELFQKVDGFLRINASPLGDQLLLRRDQIPTNQDRIAVVERLIAKGGTVTFTDTQGASWRVQVGYSSDFDPRNTSKTVAITKVKLFGDGSDRFDSEEENARFGANVTGEINDNKTHVTYGHILRQGTDFEPEGGWGDPNKHTEALVEDLMKVVLK